MRLKKIFMAILFFLAFFICLSLLNSAKAMSPVELKNKISQVSQMDGLKEGQTFGDFYSSDGVYRGSTCVGFAHAVAEKIFGSSHYTDSTNWQWFGNDGVSDLCIGDVIEYYEPASSSGIHAFIVTNLSGDNIEITDSNWNGDSVNHWCYRWTTKTDITKAGYGIKNGWHHKGSHVQNFNADTQAPTFSDGELVISSITANSYKVRVKVADNVAVDYVNYAIKGENDSSFGDWTRMTANGQYYEATINTSKRDVINVHCYAFDTSGNQAGYAFPKWAMGSAKANLGNSFTAKIVSKSKTGYCIGISGTSNGADLALVAKNSGDNTQLWNFTRLSNGNYKIINASTSNKSFDVDGGKNADSNGAAIQLWDYTNGTRQQEFMIVTYNGGYRLMPANTKLGMGASVYNTKIQENSVTSYTNNNQTFTFEKVTDISKCTIARIPDQKYTGSAIKPKVTIKNGSTTLVENTDYTLTYSRNVNVGRGTVIATGKGQYAGTLAAKFSIVDSSVTVRPTCIHTLEQTGSGKISMTYGKIKEIGIADGKNNGYEISYSTRKFGTYTVLANMKSVAFGMTGLKTGRTYYFKVRVFQTVNGMRYYSNYCTPWSITIK